jgi:hypothetical protein
VGAGCAGGGAGLDSIDVVGATHGVGGHHGFAQRAVLI